MVTFWKKKRKRKQFFVCPRQKWRTNLLKIFPQLSCEPLNNKQNHRMKWNEDRKTLQVFKTQKCRTQTIGLYIFQTIFNDDFHSFIVFELKPGFGNFRNAWIQLNNFYGKLKKDGNESIILQKGSNKWTIASIWRENMLGYLSTDIICSSKFTVRSRKTIRFSKNLSISK